MHSCTNAWYELDFLLLQLFCVNVGVKGHVVEERYSLETDGR